MKLLGGHSKRETSGRKAASADGLKNGAKVLLPAYHTLLAIGITTSNGQDAASIGQDWTRRGHHKVARLVKNCLCQATNTSLLINSITGMILLCIVIDQEMHGDEVQTYYSTPIHIGGLRKLPMQQNGDRNRVQDHPRNEGSSPTKLPSVNGPCPEFKSGTVTFHPKGAPSNKARLWIGPNPGNGALVFYFHGTGMSPNDAIDALGQDTIDDITGKGGVVLAPKGHGRYEWVIAHGNTKESDLFMVDEMVACSIQQAKIDTRHIHAMGFSSGATLTSDMVRRRSNYLASASPRSGGFDPYNPVPKSIEPKNQIAVMIYHGGLSDTWGNPEYEFYQEQSEKMADVLKSEGSFAIVCNHGRGHSEPPKSDRKTVWQFFQDHPYNIKPKPYANGLPSNFPTYCKIW